MSSSIGFRSRLLSKYNTPAELDQQQKHLTPFFNSFTNPTGVGGEVIYTTRFKLELSLADKHYVKNSGLHS